jgi:hypothetical protein
MHIMKTSDDIRLCAQELIASLSDLRDARGEAWTTENFVRLDAFARSKNPALKSYYKRPGENGEFLWDFVASAPQVGIFLVAESEQAVHNSGQIVALKHDFEKLLYVYSPIRILITKAKDRQHAQELANDLASYAQGCCLTFNPGASFILHFGLYGGSGNVSYHWQSVGEPKPLVVERVVFELVSEGN